MTGHPRQASSLSFASHKETGQLKIAARVLHLFRAISYQLFTCTFSTKRSNMAKVILVNPAVSTLGYSVITPRWLFVLAQATPVELVGDPVLVDETIQELDATSVEPGDIVGIGI